MTRVGLGLALVGALLLLVAIGLQMGRGSGGPQPGGPAPTFAFETFDGETVSLAGLRGKVVVLNFWASWCVSCVYEAADLEQVWREYGDRGVVVLGVAYNDTRPAARAYLERHDITYPNGMDPAGAISQAYRLRGVPETVLIDREGNVAPLRLRDAQMPTGKLVGPITPTTSFTPDDLRATLEALLRQEPPS